jgi:hypothetical protein
LSRAEDVYAVYWHEVDYLISKPEKEVSTTLLILPEFHLGNAEAWQSFTDTISQPLEPLGIEKMIQVTPPALTPCTLSLPPCSPSLPTLGRSGMEQRDESHVNMQKGKN